MKLEEIFIMLVLLFAFTVIGLGYINESELTITVNEKVVKSMHKTDKYLIFTDGEVLENTDLWLKGKFSSSDIQSKLKVGHKYKVKVIGVRIPILSQYRNILEFEEVD